MTNIYTRDTVVEVPYGTTKLKLQLSKGTTHLRAQDPEPVVSPGIFRQKLEAFLDTTELDLSDPVLVVADKTRWCDYPTYLPIVTDVINQKRRNDDPFKIIIAYGTHPIQSKQECLHNYGPLYDEWQFTHHDCHDRSLFEEVGVTPAGTAVRMRRDLLQSSAVITMGPMCHHYFAGYGGGRKLIFPGCGEREAIYQNHGLFLDRQNNRLSTACQPGLLDSNPVAADLFDIESHLPADLAIHGIQDSHGRICDFLIGQGRQSYLDGCRIHGRHFEVEVERMDTLISSCGGFPKDLNFIQSHKTIHSGAGFVRDNGHLIVFAECRDGVGSKTFLPWFSRGDFQDAFLELASHYEGNGGTALAMMSKTSRIHIALVTELEQEICDLLGVEKWSLAKAEDFLRGDTGKTGWIDNGSLLVNRSS